MSSEAKVGTVAVTLSARRPDVTLNKTIDAYGLAGVYGGATFYAAVIGPAGTDFSVLNTGVVESVGTGAADAGIVLGSAGTVENEGGIRAATGVAIFGGAGGAVVNDSLIVGTAGSGVYLQGTGVVENRAFVTASGTGVVLAGGGYGYNGGTVTGAAGFAVGGGAGSYVYNVGAVTAASGDGISLAADGYVSNAGQIQAAGVGVALGGGGLAYNFGTIRASGVGVFAAGGGVYNYRGGVITGTPYGVVMGGGGYVYNAGSISEKVSGKTFGAAVEFSAGGYFYNAATGTLSGDADVVVRGAEGTVVNAGTVTGGTLSSAGGAAAVQLLMGGTFTNTGSLGFVVFNSTERPDIFATGYEGGILANGKPATVFNSGVLAGFAENAAVEMKAGGLVVNSGEIAGGDRGTFSYGGNDGVVMKAGGTVLNSGYISSAFIKGAGYVGNRGLIGLSLTLAGGGSVNNMGTLDGVILKGFGTVTNSNSVTRDGFTGTGIQLDAGGTVENSGSIVASDAGIYLKKGGLILNSGYVESAYYGVSLATGGTVLNTGTIFGAGFQVGEYFGGGIVARDGGAIINDGTIAGAGGIFVYGGGTILNAGFIGARLSSNYAVYFGTKTSGRLIETPGAVFSGDVHGGGAALELASGAGVGTLALSKSFGGFGEIVNDQNAVWLFGNSLSVAGSLPIDNEGTILEQGLTIAGALSGGGTIELESLGLTLNGSVGAGQNILMTGTGERVYLGSAAGFGGTVQNFAAGDVIDLTGVARNLVSGVSFSDGVLTVSEAFDSYNITFASPSGFAGETFAAFSDNGGTGISLSGATMMAFLAPAGATASGAVLPVVAMHYPRAAANVVAGSVAAGWLDGVLRHTVGAMAPVVTIQG